jgi:hypothetical protein
MLDSLGHEASPAGVAAFYGELVDTFVVDPADAQAPFASAPILMVDPGERERVGEKLLEVLA